MGYWTNTAYVNCDDIARVETALEAAFVAEGMQRIPRPAPRARERFEPMQYATALENNRWALAVFPGAPGWTVVKSAPLELLAERAPNDGVVRLAALSARLRCPAAMFNVYDTTGAVLVETTETGDIALSGVALGSGHNPDPMHFYGQDLDPERYPLRFDTLPLQAIVDAHTTVHDGTPLVDNDAVALALYAALGGRNAMHCGNGLCVQELICHRPLLVPGAREIHVEWPAANRVWDSRFAHM
jgi:hypothetical protein